MLCTLGLLDEPSDRHASFKRTYFFLILCIPTAFFAHRVPTITHTHLPAPASARGGKP